MDVASVLVSAITFVGIHLTHAHTKHAHKHPDTHRRTQRHGCTEPTTAKPLAFRLSIFIDFVRSKARAQLVFNLCTSGGSHECIHGPVCACISCIFRAVLMRLDSFVCDIEFSPR